MAVKDGRNGNGCAVTNQTDFCFPGWNYTVVMPVQQTQERSPAENIQWPFGYFWNKWQKNCKPLLLHQWGLAKKGDRERNKEEREWERRENCSLAAFIELNGCKIAVVWLNRTLYYHYMICSTVYAFIAFTVVAATTHQQLSNYQWYYKRKAIVGGSLSMFQSIINTENYSHNKYD